MPDDLLKRTEDFLGTPTSGSIQADLGDAIGLLNEWVVKEKALRKALRGPDDATWCEHIYLEDEGEEEHERRAEDARGD